MKTQGSNCPRIVQNNYSEIFLNFYQVTLILCKRVLLWQAYILFIYVCVSVCTLLNNIITIIISFALRNISIYLSEPRVAYRHHRHPLLWKCIRYSFCSFNFAIRAARWQRSIMCGSNIRGKGGSYIMFD